MSYSLSDKQVTAILELRLQKLTAYGISEIESEINKLAKLIIDLNKILNSKKELYKIIKLELNNIKDKFAVPRRTKIIDAVLNYNIEEAIQKESVVINITNKGYIKRSPLTSLRLKKEVVKEKLALQLERRFLLFKFLQQTLIPQCYFSQHKV